MHAMVVDVAFCIHAVFGTAMSRASFADSSPFTHLRVMLFCSCEWTRRKTKSDDSNWLYLPTIYPADSLITLKVAEQS